MEKFTTILIFAPFLMALIMAFVKADKVRAALTYVFGALIAAFSVFYVVSWFQKGASSKNFDLFSEKGSELVSHGMIVGEFILMFIIIWLAVKAKKVWISLLSIVQTCVVAGIELFGPEIKEMAPLRLDNLSAIMVLIIGLVGVGIGIYAIGYMRGYHVHHAEVQDRRPFFFAIVFLFYGAMFGLVTSSSLLWLYFFWEITSVCSFLLIGYTKTQEAVDNSFKALWMNLLGGLGMAVAVVYAICSYGSVSMEVIVNKGHMGALVPIVMLAFGALTKSAQFPFSGWLLGAMVAPTPSSALLHSATMVKAGVYLLIRIAPAMAGNNVGLMVSIIGGFTFFMASLLAISQSDGKKVLAYSTISNLGLIVACTGVGVKETLWAAIFLIIFHAVTKSMLFQCVGAIENSSHSRDVEDMEGLIKRYPKLAVILMIGIAGMFLAPFGMLVSKWAALESFVTSKNILLVIFICFGSASTMFYWTKWFTKILGIVGEKAKDVTQKNEYISMFLHAIAMLALILTMPLLATKIVDPFLANMFGQKVEAVIGIENIWIMVVMVVAIFVIPAICACFAKGVKAKKVLAYMGGANAGDNKNFIDSMGDPKELKVANWYLDDYFGEKVLFKPSIYISTATVLVFIFMTIGGAF